ncbi:hypothetical protein H6784_05745 [Candidatus Nomurabacteria bacterium]|nr:hypothetical protein [Candidatus Kaiserbacteria bacterium]MCB9814880.1 hypothetical protein [Candidatus Nomurabacteria bacterium]
MDEQQIAEIKQFLETVKGRYTKAKKTLDNIEGLEIRYQKASDAAESIVTETDEIKTGVQALQNQAKVSLDQIQETRTGISGYLDAAKTTIDKLQELSKSAAALEGQVRGNDGEITALLKSSRSLDEDIAKYKKSAEENLSKSDKLLVDFQQKAEAMKTAFVEFTEIKKKIDDKNSGLDAVLKLVQQAQLDSVKLVAEINESLKVSKTNEKEIVDIKQRSTDFLSDIKTSLDEVNEKKNQVEEVSGLVIDGSFAHTFEKRKNEISKSLDSDLFSWKYLMLGGIILLILIELSLKDLTGIEGFFTRFAYTSPLIFLVLFSAVQYSKERQFLEKYAFKAASAAAVRNHIEFLLDKFKDNKRVLDFSIDTFKSIYTEPFKQEVGAKVEENSKKEKKENVVSIGVDNLMVMVDKLYEMIPDEVIVKQAVDAVVEKKAK